MGTISPAPKNTVTAGHLLRLATVNPSSLFSDATALADTSEGIMQVTWPVVVAHLEGRGKLTSFRLLYTREALIEDGVIAGMTPKTIDGSDLGTRLARIADGINEPDTADTPSSASTVE